MAVGLKGTIADSLFGALLKNTSYTGPAAIYVQLHTGSPGAAGTTAVAGNTTRQVVTFAASSGGAIASNVAATWTNVSTTETYSFFTLWDASSSGNFLGDGALTANPVTAGDTFTIASGSLTGTFSVSS